MNDAPPPDRNTRIKFENPPIQELSISLFHLPLAEFMAQHIGLYWNMVRERYPNCQQQPPYMASSTDQPFVQMPNEVFPLPRFWFYDNDQPTLVQIQRNAFMFNWRRRPVFEYPHYENVIKEFWHEFGEYNQFAKEFIGSGIDLIQRCELLYINIIATGDEDVARLPDVLSMTKGLYEVQSEARKLTGIDATVYYQVNSNIAINLAIKRGQLTDTKEPVALLELKAHGVPTDLSVEAAPGWYDAAHDAIYDAFLNVTDKTVQRTIWKPR